jgi:hypothetical protein
MTDWTVVIIVSLISTSFVAVAFFGIKLLRDIGTEMLKSDASEKAPDFVLGSLLQSARIVTVGIVLAATVILALTKNLTEGSVAILSGVAGYVLGSAGRPNQNRSSSRASAANKVSN